MKSRLRSGGILKRAASWLAHRPQIRRTSAVATAEDPAIVSQETRLSKLSRRVDLLEHLLLSEMDRARINEGLVGARDSTHAGRVIDALQKRLDQRSAVLGGRVSMLQRDLDSQRTLLGQLNRDTVRVAQRLDELRVSYEQFAQDVRSTFTSIISRLDGLSSAAQGADDRASVLQLSYEQTNREIESVFESLVKRLDGLTSRAQDVNVLREQVRDLILRQRAVPYMAQPIFSGEPRSNGHSSFDYVGFEEIFRGSRDLVRERQRVYRQFLRAGQRVIELGSGRGEFLELAREAGAAAVGVDSNGAMVELCAGQGFEVHESDALAFLTSVPESSVDLVFSAQFIEHVSPDDLYAIFTAARRVLAPGGMLIAETINPHSIEAMKCFYVDLSHVKPLFPEVLMFFARSAGFADGRIFYPQGEGFDDPAPWTHGAYALVATA